MRKADLNGLGKTPFQDVVLNRCVAAPSRRRFLAMGGAAAGLVAAAGRAFSGDLVDLPLSSEPRRRPITSAFPEKRSMILQRARPPLLETPFEVFDEGVFTPNDRFYVRWHWAVVPDAIDVDTFRLAVRGHVERTLSLTLAEIVRGLPRVELAAVNQCSGNSRGLFLPRVPGAQWAHGAMGNARWTGVRLRDLLDLAGVRAGAVSVRFNGLDEPVVPDAPDYMKSIDVDHARDGEVMIAYAMNGEQLPLLNGFPLRLIVPGWYSTYWVKMLSDIEVLDRADDSFWMTTAYTIPDTPNASISPGQTGVRMVPITRMVPRSFISNIRDGAHLAAGASHLVRGIAFGGDKGVLKVELSQDGGKVWAPTKLGADHGRYSFRRWEANVSFIDPGRKILSVRCTNDDGEVQPSSPNWNGSAFMRNVIETISVTVA